jgi:hypothetical protein
MTCFQVIPIRQSYYRGRFLNRFEAYVEFASCGSGRVGRMYVRMYGQSFRKLDVLFICKQEPLLRSLIMYIANLVKIHNATNSRARC